LKLNVFLIYMANAAQLIEQLHSLHIFTLLVLLGQEINGIDAALGGIAILKEVVEVVEGGFVVAKH
jgi:hypothetical protein